mgnify:CR=1 FL=1
MQRIRATPAPLRATAANRTGARLVGVSPNFAGSLSITLAAAIGAMSGLLIGPITTVYYDSGFLVGLKGFVAAIIGGLVTSTLLTLVVAPVVYWYLDALGEWTMRRLRRTHGGNTV